MKHLWCFFSIFSFVYANNPCDFEDDSEALFRDLAIVETIDQRIRDQLPFIYNYHMVGGYFTMPSARMNKAGVLGFGFANMPPYYMYGLVFQLFERLEVGGNYWVFKNKVAPVFGHEGFGDDAERAANIKFSLLRKEDGIPFLPEFAVGYMDFMGTRRFRSFYAAGTKTFLDLNLELTAGYGAGRMKGFYAAGAWTPFRRGSQLLKGLSLAVEYDVNNYKGHHSEHPDGRSQKTKINAGVHWNLFDLLRLSVSSLRGEKIAAQGQLTYNFGDSKGLFPKIYDPEPYVAPVDIEPLGIHRSDQEFTYSLAYAFKEQGLDLYSLRLVPGKKEDSLWVKVINVRYREEEALRLRLVDLLSSLLPSNIKGVTVVVEADGVSSQEYIFDRQELCRYHLRTLGENELSILSPLSEVTYPPSFYESQSLFERRKKIWVFTFRPMFRSYFGSASGKFKFDVGLTAGLDGYIFDQIYYEMLASYTIKASSKKIGSIDRMNPSQIINVRSDAILYHQSSSFHLDEAYAQKSWNMGKGFFSRISLGYFETAYAGVAAEVLQYSVQANWAIGVEGATLLKRNYHGLGFQHRVRKLDGFTPKYVPYYGLQYFLNLYYQYRPLKLDFKASIGQFLAWDKGIRLEGYRTFPSSLRVGLWITYTNGNDRIGGSRYFDKGFSVTMPLDIFLNKSSRTRIGYGMAAWLRDVGQKSNTGKELYETLFFERFNSTPTFY